MKYNYYIYMVNGERIEQHTNEPLGIYKQIMEEEFIILGSEGQFYKGRRVLTIINKSQINEIKVVLENETEDETTY